MSTLIILLPTPQQFAQNAQAPDISGRARAGALGRETPTAAEPSARPAALWSQFDVSWLKHQAGRIVQQGIGRLDTQTLSDVSEWVAILPASACSWHRIQIPPKTPVRQMRAVLEGLLEESILGEMEQIHFALPPGKLGAGAVSVCCTQRNWLQHCQAALMDLLPQASGRLLPESVPLIAREDDTSGNRTGALRAILRKDDVLDQDILLLPESYAVRVWPIPPSLSVWPSSGQAALKHLSIWVDPACVQRATDLFGWHSDAEAHVEDSEPEGQSAPAHAAQAPWVKWEMVDTAQRLLRIATQTGHWDLAQFDLAQAQGWWARWQRSRVSRALQAFARGSQWRTTRWALLLLAAIQVIGLNAYAWHQNRVIQEKELQLKALLLSQFPEVSVVVDPVLQMQQAVQQLRDKHADGAQAGGMAALLASLQTTLPQLAILQLRFNEQGLQLQTADQVLADAAVQGRLAEQGIQVQKLTESGSGGATWQVRYSAQPTTNAGSTQQQAEPMQAQQPQPLQVPTPISAPDSAAAPNHGTQQHGEMPQPGAPKSLSWE